MAKLDFTQFEGNRYENLIFIKAIKGTDKRQRKVIIVKCDCGNTKTVDWDNLRSGKTKSCGCKQHREKWEGSSHPLLSVWTGIKQRCYNTNSKVFHYYGGRGVTMCDEWLHDYPAFFRWCMDNGWQPGLEVDKDIKGGMVYSPDNCMIVTHQKNTAAIKRKPKLTKEITDMILNSPLTGRKLEKEIGIDRNLIGLVRNNKYWQKYK